MSKLICNTLKSCVQKVSFSHFKIKLDRIMESHTLLADELQWLRND